MRKHWVICSVDETVAVPILSHHRTRHGAIERAESLKMLTPNRWAIVQIPGYTVVYNPSDIEDLDLSLLE